MGLARKLPILGPIFRERDYLRVRVKQLEPYLTYVPPGHFYSPVPSVEEVRRREQKIFGAPPDGLPGIELNVEGQLALLKELARYAGDFDYTGQPAPGRRFHTDNQYLDDTDAFLLFAMVRHLRPGRLVEVGSGFSSALVLDTRERFDLRQMRCTFIDPYPERLERLLTEGDREACRVVTRQVQDVDRAVFGELAAGDILFIDSSHVCKTGSEVNELFFEVLPSLAAGVYVHVHDIAYPFEYPKEWVYEGRAWNEAYLVRAFLQYNQSFEIACFASYLHQLGPGSVWAGIPRSAWPGSLWLKKVR